jgi:hypothetical protein
MLMRIRIRVQLPKLIRIRIRNSYVWRARIKEYVNRLGTAVVIPVGRKGQNTASLSYIVIISGPD